VKRFIFRLDRVAALRQKQEDTCRQRHAQSLQQLEEARQTRKELALELDLAYFQNTGAGLTDRFIRAHHILRLQALLTAQRERILSCEQTCERRRLELVRAGRENLKLEQLRRRQSQRHAREQELVQGREMDEIARIQDGLRRAHAA
jgi:flagellar export protein FliJ